MATLKEALREARLRCDGELRLEGPKDNFATLYPFTTELISAYIGEFDLKNKSLLTVGSSGDQVINAAVNGARDITLVDTNLFTRYYYYLKMAAIFTLRRDELYKFICHWEYSKYGYRNYNTFDSSLYEKVRPVLEKLDSESFEFWETLINEYSLFGVRDSIFNQDEHKPSLIAKKNTYLKSYYFYQKAREVFKDVHVTFSTQNVITASFDRKFDNIWLSNIGIYLESYERVQMFNTMEKLLEENGRMLFAYIFGPTSADLGKPTSYINTLRREFGNCQLEVVRFLGINGIKMQEDYEDCAVIYKKH